MPGQGKDFDPYNRARQNLINLGNGQVVKIRNGLDRDENQLQYQGNRVQALNPHVEKSAYYDQSFYSNKTVAKLDIDRMGEYNTVLRLTADDIVEFDLYLAEKRKTRLR